MPDRKIPSSDGSGSRGSASSSGSNQDNTGVTIFGARQAGESIAGAVRRGTQWAQDPDSADSPAAPGQLTLGTDLETGQTAGQTAGQPGPRFDDGFEFDDSDDSDDLTDVKYEYATDRPGRPSVALQNDDSDEYTGIDAAWMDAGDTTLGDLLGTVLPAAAPSLGRPAAMSPDFDANSDSDFSEKLADATDAGEEDNDSEDDDEDSEDDDDNDEDDVFPESMYPAESASDSDTGVIVAAAAATLQKRERRMADRRSELHVDDAPAPQAVKPVDPQDADRWGAFAGSGPRWRDDAKDWADVDAADTSVLGDIDTQIGTLGSSRSDRSDLYSIDETSVGKRKSADRKVGKGDSAKSDSAKSDSGESRSGTGDSQQEDAAKILRFDSLAKDSDKLISVRSGGPAQRSERRRPNVSLSDGRAAADSATEPAEAKQAEAKQPGTGGRPASGPRPTRPAAPTAPSTVTARLGTGALLILAVGLVFTFTGTIGAALLAAVAIAMSSIELMHALKDRGFRPAIPAVAVGLMGVVGGGMWRGERGVMVAIVVTIAAIASWYLFGAERERPAANLAASFLSFGYPAIGAATAALLLNAPHGLGLLMPAIVCTVAHDVFAYAGGRLVGRTHFTDISPNKTVEGLVIGILGSVAASALLFGRLGWHPWSGYPQAIALGLVIGVAAPIGDLFESLLKRDLNIKDMGRLLPGHGGVFDRIDAMLLAVPATWLVAIATRHI